MTTKWKIKLKDEAIENILCLIEDVDKIKGSIKKIQSEDPKCKSTLYYSLKNLSDTLKIYSRDIDYQLKYDDHFKNI